jgi:hypothetical protein
MFEISITIGWFCIVINLACITDVLKEIRDELHKNQ